MIAFGDVSMRRGADLAGAVKNRSLTVGRGESLLPVGESGCGKIATLNMINRLIAPSPGTIRLEAEDTATREAVRPRHHIS